MSDQIDREKLFGKFKEITKKLEQWPEDKVKVLLKERLEHEGWEISEISLGKEQGKDLEACKEERVIVIEAKGEPKSVLSYRQERRGFIGGALMAIITRMTEDDINRKYCVAFPNNEYYLQGVQKRIPFLVRKKLGLHILFVEEDSCVNVLSPNASEISSLATFDDLFVKS